MKHMFVNAIIILLNLDIYFGRLCVKFNTITRRLREMIADGAYKEDIIGFLEDRNVPGDDIVYNDLADEILTNPPAQGYLTISNALQWRLQYARVIALNNKVHGIVNYEW